MTDLSGSGPTPFITFYSFKGGVGRSMALINVAGILTGRGFRVLALDVDLEAPGISFLLPPSDRAAPRPGFVELLTDACVRGPEADLFALPPADVVQRYSHAYAVPLPIRHAGERLIRIMPAGRLDGDYQARLDGLQLGQLYRDGVGQPLIANFKRMIKDSGQFDFVLVDSRTGFSDEAGICTRDLADSLMVVMGFNRQHVEGTAAFLATLGQIDRSMPFRVTLSPVPPGQDAFVEEREQEAAQSLSRAVGGPVDLRLRISYYPELALTEEPGNRGYLYDAYEAMEDAVRGMVGYSRDALCASIEAGAKAHQVDLVLRKLHVLRKVDDSPATLEGLVVRCLFELAGRNDAGELRRYLAAALPAASWAIQRLALGLQRKGLADADLFHRRSLEAFPNDSYALGNYAIFLTAVRHDHDGADSYYRRALAVEPDHATILGNYANFLTDVRLDHDQAEMLYQRAMVVDPNHAPNLGNYANFLTKVRHDHGGAEAHYKRAVAAGPEYATALGNYAAFLARVRSDDERAEHLFQRAVAADPNHSRVLGNYAHFLTEMRSDHDGAEILYQRALSADPEDAHNLGSYAGFLKRVRGDHDGAEALYQRALAADLCGLDVLENYAVFLAHVRGDRDKAEALYQQVLAKDSHRANTLGNYAQLLFVGNRQDEGIQMLSKAWEQDSRSGDLECELHFYACAHAWQRWPESLASLKLLLQSGSCSKGWPLRDNVAVAINQGHPAPALLAALARVVSGEALIDTLSAFPAWERGRF